MEGGFRIPYRGTDEDAEVGKRGKNVESKNDNPKTRAGSRKKKSDSDSGRMGPVKERVNSWYDGDSCGGLLLGQPPFLPPVPLTG